VRKEEWIQLRTKLWQDSYLMKDDKQKFNFLGQHAWVKTQWRMNEDKVIEDKYRKNNKPSNKRKRFSKG